MTIEEAPASRGRLAAELSTAMVRMHSDHYGRGPTKARTYLFDDLAICVMQDVYTTVERTLIRTGREAQVREMRQAFQDAMEDEFRTAVEVITGRKVRAFLSQIEIEPEVSVELFLFEPDPEQRGEPPVADGD